MAVLDGFVVWFTGMPGAGKTTLAHAMKNELEKHGAYAEVIDSESVRDGLFAHPEYSFGEGAVVHRAILLIAEHLCRRGIPVVIAATGYRAEWRKTAQTMFSQLIEVRLDCSTREAARRCAKRAKPLEMGWWFTEPSDIGAGYDEGAEPDLEFDTEDTATGDIIAATVGLLQTYGYINPVSD